MKWLFLLLTLFFISACVGVGVEVQPKISYPSNRGVEMGYGVKGKISMPLSAEDKAPSLYIHGSYDTAYMRKFGQRAGNLTTYGGGIGMEAPITKYLSVYGDLGYYYPISELSKKIDAHGEVPWLYWRKFATEHSLPMPAFTTYGYKLRGNVGGELGINLHYNYKHLTTGLDVGYQFRKFEEQWYGYVGPVTMWETKESSDFGGILFGISLEYTF